MNNQTNNLTVDFLSKHLTELGKWIKRYEKFPPEIRFLMLIDKIQMLLMVGKLAFAGDCESNVDRINDDDKLTPEEKSNKIGKIIKNSEALDLAIELVKHEFDTLEDFIQSDTRSILKNMENKLDEFLDGPDYENGNKIMQEAKADFDEKVNEKS